MFCIENIIEKRIEETSNWLYLRHYRTYTDEDVYVVDINYDSNYASVNTTIYYTANLESARHFLNIIYQNMINWRHDNR